MTALRIPVTAALTAVLFLSLCSCSDMSRSGDGSWFHFTSFTGRSGRHAEFTVDMSDSTCAYSIDIVARMSRRHAPGTLPLEVTVVSPEGHRASETVFLPSDLNSLRHYTARSEDRRIRIAESAGSYDVSWRYRDGIVPGEKGDWLVCISAPDTLEGLSGIGISVSGTPVKQ